MSSPSVQHSRFELVNLCRLPADKLMPLLALACGHRHPNQLARLIEAYRQPARCLLGYVADGDPIGLAGLEIQSVGAARLAHLAIAPHWRSRGLGRALLAAVQQSLALYRLDAETDIEALGFYRRCGWASRPGRRQASGLERFSVHWLEREQVLKPAFRFAPPPLHSLYLPETLPALPEQNLTMLRLDLIHPLLSGNKWFKLRPYLMQARRRGLSRLVTLGGAWSNHLYATAAAGRLLGFDTIGLVRGELPDPLNPILSFARDCGMQLVPVTRSEYRRWRESAYEELYLAWPDTLLIPEGGAGELGVSGAEAILDYVPPKTPSIGLACGTATTLAGLVRAAKAELSVLGVAVIKGGEGLGIDVLRWQGQPPRCNWAIEADYHLGGYARRSAELEAYMAAFAALNPTVPLEPVYTGRLLYALSQRAGRFGAAALPRLVLHTGGVYPEPAFPLQGSGGSVLE